MAQSYPRLGLDNLLYENRNDLVATTTATGYDVANLADWSPGTYWKPTFVSNPPATEYVYCYPLTDTDRVRVANWYFEDWTDGTSSAPDGWALVGSSATVARDGTNVQIHNYGAQVTRSGADCYLELELPNWEGLVGLQVTVGAWVYATAASRARIGVDDGVGQSWSSYHTGGSSFEFLTVTREVVYNATTVKIRLGVDTGDTSATFDGVAAYKGDTCNSTPHAHAVDYLAAIDHNFDSASITCTLEYTTDSSPGPGSSWSTHLTLSTSNDRAGWVDTGSAQTRAAWRLKFAATTGSQAAFVGVAAFGSYTQLPELIGDGFNPYDRTLSAKTPLSKNGTPLQRALNRRPLELNVEIPPGTPESDITGTWKTFLEHAHDRGKALPFFFQWDDGDHGSDTFLCWLADGSSFRAPLGRAYQATRLGVSKWLAVNE